MAYSGVAVNLVACTHQAMAVITYLVAVMLAEALTHLHCILVVAWAAVVIWVVEALDPTIEVHRSVQILRDKKELADTQKELSKLHVAQKDSSASHNSQQNEERSLTPYAKKNDSSADSTGQQLALALPSQVAPPPPPAAPQQQMVQPLSQPQGYYLPPGQYPPSQVPPLPPQQQQQQQPPPSQYMQSQVPPPKPQQQPLPQVHSLPQYQ